MLRILLGSGVQRFINFFGMDDYGLCWRGRYYAYKGEWTLVRSGSQKASGADSPGNCVGGGEIKTVLLDP